MQPVPAAVTACLKKSSITSPAANTPGTEVTVLHDVAVSTNPFGLRATCPVKKPVLGSCPIATTSPPTSSCRYSPVTVSRRSAAVITSSPITSTTV